MGTPISFSLDQSLLFADAAGDWNPIHVDPVAARRSLAGAPVVHGINTMLTMLDRAARPSPRPGSIAELHVTFEKPVSPGEPMRLGQEDGSLTLEGPNGTAVTVDYRPGPHRDDLPALPHGRISRDTPAVLDFARFEGGHGRIDLFLDDRVGSQLYPALAGALQGQQISLLMALSRLVGMVVPGLHSLFSEAELSASAAAEHLGPVLTYRVRRVDRRFRLVTIDVAGAGLAGTVRAFFRPEIAAQPAMSALSGMVEDGSFTQQRALVVGGSRGMGELAAKLLGAGGAAVLLTYHVGRDDAEAVVAALREAGVTADAAALNVLDLSDGALDEIGRWRPTHLYYFATPFIGAGNPAQFSQERLRRFRSFYVDGFAALVDALAPHGLRHAFYPSSAYLDQRPANMAEYCEAKLAGEAVCQALRRRHPALRIQAPRLPRVATDQTAALVPLEVADAAPILVKEFREAARPG
jgi:NAD(P)-dependent dehydrogenase (short-subunit alcohol dehydrogenase family)